MTRAPASLWPPLLWLACFAAPVAAQPSGPMREMSTDRPDKTESPYTVDAGHIQVELDLVTTTRDRDGGDGGGTRAETLTVAPFNFKYGLDDRTDVQLVVEPYLRQTVTDRATGRRDRIDGFGDVTVRLKRNLWGNDGGATALAVMPFVRLPTSRDGLGSGAAEFGLIVPLAVSVADGLGLRLMTQVDLVREAGNGYTPSFINSATVAFDLTERLGLYTEVFTERSTEQGAEWVVTGDVGLTYALSDNIQLDTGVNIGLTDAADDLNLFIGVSRRF